MVIVGVKLPRRLEGRDRVPILHLLLLLLVVMVRVAGPSALGMVLGLRHLLILAVVAAHRVGGGAGGGG